MRRFRLVPIVIIMAISLLISEKVRAGEDDPRREKVMDRIVAYVKAENPRLSKTAAKGIARHVYRESRANAIDYRLILAVMKVESNFRHDATSPKGAQGLLQITPGLGKEVARDMGMTWKGRAHLWEPEKNIKIGVRHLSYLIEAFENLPSALTAYNEGPAAKRPDPQARYAKAVIREYEKALSVLPDADNSR
jgi:soluble lytic murein transglycosylase